MGTGAFEMTALAAAAVGKLQFYKIFLMKHIKIIYMYLFHGTYSAMNYLYKIS